MKVEELNELQIILGTRIVQLRIQKKMKQKELADRMDIDDATLRKIEKGKLNLTLKTLLRISSAFELSLSELFDFNFSD
ncbi:MAG: helix-turn-helix domain-containing protein [Carboxylicivirga sp.]|jgi:transcriptional regulator with XRE-family HTH domain|nr:helix-turn-helix domain-containing protein [Carboxylicivirga sp.]